MNTKEAHLLQVVQLGLQLLGPIVSLPQGLGEPLQLLLRGLALLGLEALLGRGLGSGCGLRHHLQDGVGSNEELSEARAQSGGLIPVTA